MQKSFATVMPDLNAANDPLSLGIDLGFADQRPPHQGGRLLVVDDDVELCKMLREYLGGDGYRIDMAHNSTEGLQQMLRGVHDLIILDVMLGSANGLEVLRTFRAQQATPVLMLTAKGEDVDRIIGLELGADDYLGKPFNPRELAARVRAILRRSEQSSAASPSPTQLVAHDLEMDFRRRLVSLAGTPLSLTSIEFEVLKVLADNVGKVVARKAIYWTVFHRSMSPLDRSLSVHVCNLRQKIVAAVGEPDRIKTVHGIGYMLVPPL